MAALTTHSSLDIVLARGLGLGAIVQEALHSLAMLFADARQLQDILLAISGFFVLAAGVVTIIKRPVSFGTAFVWKRLDALRDARIVPYWTLNASAEMFKGLTGLVWVVCGVGVVWMAMDPQPLMSAMTAPFAPGTFAVEALGRVSAFFDAIARGATPLLLVLSAWTVTMICIAVYQFYVLRDKDAVPGGKVFQTAAEIILLPLMLYFAWFYGSAFLRDGLYIIGTFGPAFYQEFMVQMRAFSALDILFVAFFGAFILTTTVLFVTVVWGVSMNVSQHVKKLLKTEPRSLFAQKRLIDPSKFLLTLYVFGAGVLLSFLATASAARVGLSFGGTLDVTLTFQLLAVNALFDGLTLAITLRLMAWAAEPLRIRNMRLKLVDHAERLKAVGTAHRWQDTANSPADPRLRLYTKQSDDLFSAVARDFARDLQKWHRDGRLVWTSAQLRAFRRLEYDRSWFSDPGERTQLHTELSEIATAYQPPLEALEKRLRRRLPIALVVDVVAAFAFCLAVLWLGLIGTPAALDWEEIWHVAIGGFEAGAFTELGPLFWITHTTFIPTLLIWAALLVMFLLCSGVSRTVDRLIHLRPLSKVAAAARERVEQARMALTKTATVFGGIAGSIYALDYAGFWFFGAP